ncbi:MAG: tRNA pseudouridine(13) synthase TruD [Planctomycetota bacterium]|nr:tRNA pseudouridine(13) synthase TruD [Planctomycetota bacterium]MDA1211078.1 tRNA pseudouridine(13) synthase TruD [Planctomycetota bacterium]
MTDSDSTSTSFPSSEYRSDWPFLTEGIPGIGGTLKHEPEDFVVEEIPLYPFSGEGEHLLLWIEKRDIAAEKFTRHIARELNVSPRDIGVAGLKDRRAVTRQWISVPAKCEPLLAQIETKRISHLETTRHKNKLRTGHLKGNRFSIVIRDIGSDALATASAFCASALRTGLPNYYGEQRMGHDQETLKTGFALLRGEIKPRDLPSSSRAFLLRMSLSAVQSQLFNEVLADRLQDGLMHTVLPGDVMQVIESGGVFVAGVDSTDDHQAADIATEQIRMDNREIALTGPLFGPKMKSPSGVVAEREAAVLERYGIAVDQFQIYDRLTSGTRRPLLVFPEEMHTTADEHGLRIEFTLPSGSYATVALRELMKSD